MDGIQPTYQLGGDGFGGNSFFWVFALLALMNGGFGFNGANSMFGRNATVEDLNTTSNFTRLENQVRANAELTERKTDAINNGICSLGYEMANKFAATDALVISENQKTRDLIQQNTIASLQAQVNDLKMDAKLCGIPRINPSAYGVYPYAQIGCNCNSNI